MSTIQFWWGHAENKGSSLVYHADAKAQETVTSSGSVANTTATAPTGDLYCCVTNSGTDAAYVSVDVNAVASATNGKLVIAGTSVDFANVPKGSRGSVINA